jgi:hypothetical protein
MADAASIAEIAAKASDKGPPPVHLWNPPFCGDIDMRIAVDGTWFYQGTPIGRPAMVRLFASILRKDPDRHVLVTPVERVGIKVDDVPFLAVELRADARTLSFRTNVDDWTTASAERPMRFERDPSGGYRPYVLVRGGLWARATRPVYLELVEHAETRAMDGVETFGVASGGAFFPIAPIGEIDAA